MRSFETARMFASGATVAERFVVDEIAGSGGVGVVYRARDLRDGAPIALKFLFQSEAEGRLRFDREARVLATLEHQGIVRYVSHGATPDETPYLAMQWLDGEDLRARLRRGPLSVEDSIRLIRRVADALGAAHAAGIVHRDIKPSNLFLVGGRIADTRIIDFGLARPDQSGSDLTQTGALLGTPGYMAPEQARGARQVTPRVDVFALGCVLFECLAGRPAFAGDTIVEVLSSILLEPAPHVRSVRREVPEALDQFVARLLSREPGERPADGSEVVRALDALGVMAAPTRRETAFTVGLRRVFRAPQSLVFAVLADTNRWNRLVGSPLTQYAYEALDETPGARRTRVGRAEILGADARWTEVGEMIEGRFLVAERRFLQGLFTCTGLRVDAEPHPDGCEIAFELYARADERVPEAAMEMARAHFEKRLALYFTAVEALFAGAEPALLAVDPAEPPFLHARRVVLAGEPNRALSGRTTVASDAEFEFRAAPFASAPVDEPIRNRLLSFLRAAPDDHLRQLRPFEVAGVWGHARRDVLRAFLHATRAGLVDLRWQLTCPTCRVGAASVSALADVGRRAHCAECQTDFDLDFASNIEATFQVNRALRDVEPLFYCAGSPAFRPHTTVQLEVDAGGARSFTAVLPPVALMVRVLPSGDHALISQSVAVPGSIVVRVRDTGVDVVCVDAVAGATAPTSVELINDTSRSVRIQIERSGVCGEIVSGTHIATLPEFCDLFAAECPSEGIDLAVSTLSVLFAEVDGVDALCDRLGDGRAFAIAEARCARIAAAVAKFEGAVVRTLEQTVMACFTSSADALAAALALCESTSEDPGHGAAHDLSVRVGLHDGPCLAVRGSGRMDFFGRTVKIAAALRARAPRGQIAVTSALLEHDAVARLLRDRGDAGIEVVRSDGDPGVAFIRRSSRAPS